MGLLTPAFLAGLAALSIPLLIHLIRRERQDAVEFPSLMFLSRIPHRTVKHRRIRNWWLFVLRSLVLILLVGAFARPFMPRGAETFAGGEVAREVVILLDRSYSMSYGDRWERAVTAAREAVDGLGTNDRATLAFFDASVTAATQPTTDRARLRLALDSARAGSGVTRYTPALKLAQSILNASELAHREVVLISDFQQTGWDGAAGAQLPPGAVLRPVVIGGEDVANVMVTRVTLARTRVAGRERVTPTVHLAARGGTAARSVTVTLTVDGRALQTVDAQVPANGTASAELQPLTLAERAARATVHISDDALAADNSFNFMLAPDAGMRVLVVEPPGRDGTLYLRHALELADEPPFQVTLRRDGMPTANELERADVVVLSDVLPPEGDAGRRLVEWVNEGGGVVLSMGDRTAGVSFNATARALAGGVPDRVVDRIEGGGARLGYLDYSHPVFEAFRAPRAGAFSAARFYRYRGVSFSARGTSDSTATVLARFEDGAPALVERTLGRGRVLVWGSTLSADWSNMPLEPVYLPFVHQLARRAAGFTAERAWTTVGQVVDVGQGTEGPLLVVSPRGARTEVGRDNTLLTLTEQGFYEVRETRGGSRVASTFAVNVDVSESELGAMDVTEVAGAVTPVEAAPRGSGSISLPPAEQERSQALWWYLLITVFALLTAEAVFANRRSRRTA